VRLLNGPAMAQEVQVAATPVALGPKVPPELTQKGAWPVEGKDLAMTRYVDDSNISAATVDTLGVAWSFPIDVTSGSGAITSNPIVLGNTVYIEDMLSNIVAIDIDSGKQIWRTEFNTTSEGPNGIALGYGLAVSVLGDTSEVVALDAATGKLKWRTDLSSNIGEGIDMAPIVYDNTVYVSTVPGNSNAFYRGGQKGIFYALDISSGDVIWQWDTTVDNLWGNARVNSGGGLWHPPSIDDDGMLYLGVANPGPWPGNSEFPNGSSRPGDNLYTNSVVKLDPSTGSVVWYVQIVPHDLFDLDNQLSPVLTTVKIGGVDTGIVVTSGKHGQVVAVSRDGQELWRTAIGKHENDNLKAIPDGKTIEEYPSSLGGVETPFSIANGVGFFATMNLARYYTSTGKSTTVTPVAIGDATGEVVAIELTTGKILWDVVVPTAPFAGTTVVGDLVFAGGLDGVLRAFNVKDGSEVWKWQAPAGINATLAVVGDYLFLGAGGALLASKDTASPTPTPASALVALKLGASKATPAS
ncbi:MAG TPA: PQQ-binding-like beta-propeller repeat protein, partial [Thermomicrobiales bacterium]|nr:PQQ-binding-like beta-propeller repeat protein [Thermomicrobiales bacterium]